jgi:hypothetical protein
MFCIGRSLSELKKIPETDSRAQNGFEFGARRAEPGVLCSQSLARERFPSTMKTIIRPICAGSEGKALGQRLVCADFVDLVSCGLSRASLSGAMGRMCLML